MFGLTRAPQCHEYKPYPDLAGGSRTTDNDGCLIHIRAVFAVGDLIGTVKYLIPSLEIYWIKHKLTPKNDSIDMNCLKVLHKQTILFQPVRTNFLLL